MTEVQRHIRLTVDVDPSAEPIRGVLRHQHGTDRSFTGWMALVRAVELALATERERLDPPPDQPMGERS